MSDELNPTDTPAPESSGSAPEATPAPAPQEVRRGATVSDVTSTSAPWKALALVLGIALVAVIAFVLGRGGLPGGGTETSGEQSSSTSATQEQTSSEGTTTGQLDHAPSQTNPDVLQILRAEPKRVADDPRALGSVDAPVVMVEFSDYSCPVCAYFARETEPGLRELIDAGTLRVEYRDFVIFAQYGSDIAARGGWAAANQGRFVEYRHALWGAADPNGHAQWTADRIVELAQEAGVPDIDRFRADLTSQEITDKVNAETQHAQSLGINGTPFFMINDAVIGGAQDIGYVRRTIEEQVRTAQK